jgi:hypothetical protein
MPCRKLQERNAVLADLSSSDRRRRDHHRGNTVVDPSGLLGGGCLILGKGIPVFTTQMQLPGAVQSAPAGQAAGGNAPMTRTACINAANPIPAEAQCKVDQVDRRGSLVTWAMTCNSPRGEIHSAGSARYAGNTWEEQ